MLIRTLEQIVQAEARAVSVGIGVSELIYDRVEEAHPCFIVELLCNLLEKIVIVE